MEQRITKEQQKMPPGGSRELGSREMSSATVFSGNMQQSVDSVESSLEWRAQRPVENLNSAFGKGPPDVTRHQSENERSQSSRDNGFLQLPSIATVHQSILDSRLLHSSVQPSSVSIQSDSRFIPPTRPAFYQGPSEYPGGAYHDDYVYPRSVYRNCTSSMHENIYSEIRPRSAEAEYPRLGYQRPIPRYGATRFIPYQRQEHSSNYQIPHTQVVHYVSSNFNLKVANRVNDSLTPIYPKEHAQSVPIYPKQMSSLASTEKFQFKDSFDEKSSDSSESEEDRSNTPMDPTRRYECKVCHKWFTRPSSLRTHMNSHTGERPYKCEYPGCSKTFTVSSNLKRHMKICQQKTPNERFK